jgi:hypothetical protein
MNEPLYPAAQAVKDHFLANASISLERGLAAALSASMEYLLPLPPFEIGQGMTCKEWCDANRATLDARQKLIAIASELKTTGEWRGADHQNGPWRPIPKPQGFPSTTDGPAPATINLADRLALAVCRGACPTGGPCPVEAICSDCRRDSAAVAHEIARQLRERNGSSATADWLDGVGCHTPGAGQSVHP